MTKQIEIKYEYVNLNSTPDGDFGSSFSCPLAQAVKINFPEWGKVCVSPNEIDIIINGQYELKATISPYFNFWNYQQLRETKQSFFTEITFI